MSRSFRTEKKPQSTMVAPAKLLQRRRANEHEPEIVPPIVHEVVRSPGEPLDAETRAFFEPRFGHDFSQVRIHTDEMANKSVRNFKTRAYTIGNHVAFSSGQYSPATYDGRELIFHELIHVAQNRGKTRDISFWNKEEHHRLTKEIVDFYRSNPYSPSIIHDPLFGGEQFYQIINSSFNMDVRAKRLLWTGPKFVLKIAKGEGPEHGEDGDYKNPANPGAVSDVARNQNVKLQKEYVGKAVKFFRQETSPEVKQVDENRVQVTPPVRRFLQGKIQLTPNVRAMFKALGDACHVAQDRGAHWEGTKGMGHDDPRAKQGTWDPDNPKDNDKGYKIARQNTYEAFREWTWDTTMGGSGKD